MEVRDGFIESVFTYCDRWCETCALTSWCRLFADSARIEAALDPHLQSIVEAPPLPEDVPPDVDPEFLELLREAEAAASSAPVEDRRALRRERNEDPMVVRAGDYCEQVHRWLKDHPGGDATPADPRSVVSWYSTLVPAKIARAVMASKWADPDEGSAKVALIGLERSHAAWLRLSELGLAGAQEAHDFIAQLVWLADALEKRFPRARAFVRPGFDEPEAVERLRASER
jgi:hypothetical protein